MWAAYQRANCIRAQELIVLEAHGLHVLGGLGPLCGERPNLLPINMYTCSLN
jgi:hypothetical protein